MINRDIYINDPENNELENKGVAEVKDDQSEAALKTLRYELRTFVCDGEYEAGLNKIMSAYLTNLRGDREQPGVWISGFFGSGKSHLAKMLRALWVNQGFSDGAYARDIPDLPTETKDYFVELSNVAQRYGGLHAASGTLGAGADNNVRMALLNIVFKSAGLPDQYHQARFVMWLKKKGIFDDVKAFVEAEGDNWADELEDLYVSRSIANALLQKDSDLAGSVKEVRNVLLAQYRNITDVTNQQMVDAIYDALEVDGNFPLTLIVLDEVQQYVGNDSDKAHQVQEMVETCCKHSKFKSKLLFVATGQSALSGMPNLQRLMGRFQIAIQLSDTDVEAVIQKVILQKKQSAVPKIDAILQQNLGEIARQLRGTKIEHHTDDEENLVAEYPLLPVRRRFWEKVLRIVDTTGTASQLRNQLRVMHEAAQVTADKPLGNIIPADFIYEQISTSLIQTGVISKEIAETIGKLSTGDDDERLKSRILSLVLLIGKLPTDPAADSGVRATEDVLADLLIDDLNNGKDYIRTNVPRLLKELSDDSLIMPMETSSGTEYRLQTQESAQWHDTFRQEQADLRGNIQRVENTRMDLLNKRVKESINQIRLTQGKVNEARQILISLENELPKDANEKIYAWVQDGWEIDEKSFISEARQQDPNNPTIFIYIPDRNRSDLTEAIVKEQAALATLEKRGIPNTDAGRDAQAAMSTRYNDAKRQVRILLDEIFSGIQILQAGGAEVEGSGIAERVESAAKMSLIRLYNEFDEADNPKWAKVYDEARKDNGLSALDHLGYSGDPEQHPVCAKIKRFIGVSKKGSEISENFSSAPYGWPKDAIEGALFVLLASGILIAKDTRGNPVSVTNLERKQISQTTFYPENISISPVDKIKIRNLLNSVASLECQSGEELIKIDLLVERARQLAKTAGGSAPYPAIPGTKVFDDIAQQSGNAKLKYVLDSQDYIRKAFTEWTKTAELIDKRQHEWLLLNDLLDLSKNLAFYQPIKDEVDSIISQRSLLTDPNPVQPLLKDLEDKLRNAAQHRVEDYQSEYTNHLQSLEEDSQWQQLDDAKQQSILNKYGLSPIEEPSLENAGQISEALNEVGFEQWNDRKDSVVGRFDKARREAVQLLLPKTQHIVLPKATFHTEEDVEAWLAEVKQQIVEKLNDGPVTF